MNKGIGFLLLNSSVAAYLFATGILGVTRNTASEISMAVNSLLGRGDFADIIIVVLAVLAIAAGIFILIKFFGINIEISEILLIILAVTWVVFIVMIDIAYPLNHKGTPFINWLRSIGSHVMVLAGILLATERFGG
jgi:hypothetical protein